MTGIGDFEAVAAQVSGDPATIRAIAQIWSQAAASGEEQTKAVNQAAATASDGWTGLAQQEFDYILTQFGAASRSEQESLLDGAKALNNAADALETAQTKMTSLGEDLNSQIHLVNSAVTTGTPPAIAQSAQARVIASATAEAQKVADEAGHALDQASDALEKVLTQMKSSLAFSALPVPTTHGFIPQVSAPSDAGKFSNELSVAMFLVEHHYSKAAAAGIAATIAGESLGDPESVGSGGWGLIGWTPQTPGQYQNLYPTNNAAADLAKQMPAILAYNQGKGGVDALNSITDPVEAARYYSKHFEGPLVPFSDVRPDVATAVFKALGG
jgi:uncharacterized protein YukE